MLWEKNPFAISQLLLNRPLVINIPKNSKFLEGGISIKKIDRLIRNVEEVVTVEELERLIETKTKPKVYVGYEPSGKIHLGHVITVNKLLDMQTEGFEVTVLLADLHAYLNQKGTLEEVRELASYNERCFKALGLISAKYVFGSGFELEEEYTLNVLRLARESTLNRAKRSMDEISRSAQNPMVSQMIYPLMQAIDIATLGIDLAVGGMDQRKIHMLARDTLPKLGFNSPVCIHTPILIGLDGEKMSSSKGNYISIDEPKEVVEGKIKSAYCPLKVEKNPILSLYKYLIFPTLERAKKELLIERPRKYGGDIFYKSYEELERNFIKKEIHPMDLKNCAANYLNELLKNVRKLIPY
jgi:tyrosyl-tRNA synthetase